MMVETAVEPADDTFESFLTEHRIRDEVYRSALNWVLACQSKEARKATNLGAADFTEAMRTRRSQIDRVLDRGISPSRSIP